jgi:putative transposase
MKGKRHTPEQIVRKLREADRLQAEGADVDAVCRHLEISVQTYQRWRSQFKAMRPEDVLRLKALEKENARLKRIVGDQALDIDMLREVARGRMKVKSSWLPLSAVGAASLRRCVGRRFRRVRLSVVRACVVARG